MIEAEILQLKKLNTPQDKITRKIHSNEKTTKIWEQNVWIQVFAYSEQSNVSNEKRKHVSIAIVLGGLVQF